MIHWRVNGKSTVLPSRSSNEDLKTCVRIVFMLFVSSIGKTVFRLLVSAMVCHANFQHPSTTDYKSIQTQNMPGLELGIKGRINVIKNTRVI